MFKQVEIPGKGQGLVATKKLPVGTVIVTETPLITVEDLAPGEFPNTYYGEFPNTYIIQEYYTEKFRSLPNNQKIEVLSLYDPGLNLESYLSLSLSSLTETELKFVRIFKANSIDLCGHKEMNVNKSGLYKTISRINHSCAPNVVWSWVQGDKSKSVKQVRVCREVKEGEEILASYCWSLDAFPSKGERQQKLLKNWKFICKCEVCSLTGEKFIENENSRKKIRELHEAIPVKASIGLVKEALEDAKEKLRIMKSIKREMMVDIPGALMECCELAARCNLPSSNAAQLMRKAKDMSELYGDCFIHNYNTMEKRISRIGN